MNLTDITAGQNLTGVIPGATVTVIAVTSHGPDAATLVFNRPDGRPEARVIYAADAAKIEPTFGSTRPFDASARDFKTAAEAQRIRQAGSIDPMLAVATSDVRPLPHQLKAVYGELLDRTPLRFLLADDPGAGKTIMAGLYIKELMLRGDVERCLIVAPGGLVDQWLDELLFKFGLTFQTLHPQDIINNPAHDPFEKTPFLVARMDQLSRNDDLLDRLAQTEWDLTVVDEAHRMSASYFGNKLNRTRRFELGQLLGRISRHLLLMTATPHNGKETDFQLFMSLLDRDMFEGRYRDGTPTDTRHLMRRMVKEDLLTMDGTPLFPTRVAQTVPYELTAPEQDLYEDVTAYVRDGMNRADRLTGKTRNTVGFALTVLQRRLASSPEAIYQSLRRRAARLGTRRAAMVSGSYVDDVPETPYDFDYDDEFATEEQEQLEEEVLDAASAARTVEELDKEIQALRLLEAKAAKVRHSGEDRKWSELRSILQEDVLGQDRGGTPRKIIIFTEHKDTLDYLRQQVSAVMGGHAVVAIHGGVNRPARRRVTEEFNKNPEVQVLIATDAAGEGLNLQAAHLMVNYDLPWNPNRIEQRFGRIHRIGQTEECRLWNLVAVTTREGQVYESLLTKVEQQRAAYGGKVFDVLGAGFSEGQLRTMMIQAIREGDRPETRAHLEKVIDEKVAVGIQTMLAEKALATEMSDLDVSEIQRQMDEARARRLQPHFIEAAFRDAFTRLGGRIVRREAGRFEIPNVPGAVRHATRSPIPTRYERVTFDLNRVRIDGAPDADLLAPGHPLHDAVMRLAVETWGSALERGTVLVSDTTTAPALLVGVEEEVRDATGESIAKRFGYAFVDAGGGVRPAGPAPYLDCVAAPPGTTTDRERAACWLTDAEQRAVNWRIANELPAYLAATSRKRRAELERTREIVQQRLNGEINRLYEDAAVASEKLSQGGTPPESVESLTRKAEELQQRLVARLAHLDRQLHMSTAPPRVVMTALVLPYQELHEELPQDVPLHAADGTETDRRAVTAVLAAERTLGREPFEMVHNNEGYDVRSVLLEPIPLRDESLSHTIFIEVKGRITGAKEFFVSHSQVNTGKNSPESFRLAMVEVSPDGPDFDRVRYVGDPFTGVELGGLHAAGVVLKWDKNWERGSEPF